MEERKEAGRVERGEREEGKGEEEKGRGEKGKGVEGRGWVRRRRERGKGTRKRARERENPALDKAGLALHMTTQVLSHLVQAARVRLKHHLWAKAKAKRPLVKHSASGSSGFFLGFLIRFQWTFLQ